eukprot:350643-Chlamydomonas_euryale.AAC.4
MSCSHNPGIHTLHGLRCWAGRATWRLGRSDNKEQGGRSVDCLQAGALCGRATLECVDVPHSSDARRH